MFIYEQQPSSGSISVILITKYIIDSVLFICHITMLLHVMINIIIFIYHCSTITARRFDCILSKLL